MYIVSGVSNTPSLSIFGAGLGFIAWLWAIREAWFTRAWLWLLGIFFTFQIGALVWGILGPGRLAPLAEQKVRALRNLPPQTVGMQAPAWTPALVKSYLELQGFTVEEPTLLRYLRRIHWLVD
jgi:hypothetical protein